MNKNLEIWRKHPTLQSSWGTFKKKKKKILQIWFQDTEKLLCTEFYRIPTQSKKLAILLSAQKSLNICWIALPYPYPRHGHQVKGPALVISDSLREQPNIAPWPLAGRILLNRKVDAQLCK